jgi:transcriptional regulator with XRE-family HTH domain
MAKKKREGGVIATLKEIIRSSGQSLNKLSEVSGVDKGRISRFLRGERALTSDAIDKLCRALRLKLVKDERGS